MKPSVRAAFSDFSARFEGRIPTMYLDVRGLLTTGIGNLADPVELALSLPWRHSDGTLATAREVEREWLRVKVMPAGLVWTRYVVDGALRLDEDAIDDLVMRQLMANEAILARRFPAWSTWPADAQLGTLSLAWAVGANLTAWPKFCGACAEQDWLTAAVESQIRDGSDTIDEDDDNPGIVPRNNAQRLLFGNAHAVARNPITLTPDELYWPQSLDWAAPEVRDVPLLPMRDRDAARDERNATIQSETDAGKYD